MPIENGGGGEIVVFRDDGKTFVDPVDPQRVPNTSSRGNTSK